MQVVADTVIFTPFHVLGFFAFMNSIDGGSYKVGSNPVPRKQLLSAEPLRLPCKSAHTATMCVRAEPAGEVCKRLHGHPPYRVHCVATVPSAELCTGASETPTGSDERRHHRRQRVPVLVRSHHHRAGALLPVACMKRV